ncbi:Uncharacterised protein [Mycobacterium tuberculosis]|nr:Uncharacterised protein [Mycobacterium tuberculosis]
MARLSQMATSPGAQFQRMVFSGMVIRRCSTSNNTLDSWLSNPTKLRTKSPASSVRSPVSGCTRTTGCSVRKSGFSNT